MRCTVIPLNLKAKKNLGQHFLIDQSVVTQVLESIQEYCAKDMPILEVGPGPGTLTYELAQQYDRFCAVEFDRDMVAILRQRLATDQLIREDILSVNFDEVHKGDSFNLVGNFPYNISSQIVFKILDNKERVPVMVGMFQKEMATRICASPGTKANGIITLLTQAYYEAKKLFDVAPEAFDPPPKVQSSVIMLKRKENLTLPCDPKLYKQVIKLSFQQRRKKLRNTLKPLLNDKTELMDHELLQNRPEHLGVADFVEIVGLLTE